MNGINTGKVIIGSAYFGQKRNLNDEELKMQSVLLAEMPGNAANRAAVLSLSPEAYQHMGQHEKTQQKPFKRFREFLSRLVGRFA